MILEALNFAATWLVSGRRRADEINASVRLWARARRCARDWSAHEENCKAFVRDNMPERGRVAVVLGSGLLRDVSVEDLSRAFDEVWLYDLQHLASVRLWARARGIGNLRFLQQDLSAGLDMLRDDAEVDLVVSANLLSQLGVAAERAGLDVESVIAGHVAALRAAPGRRLLLTDRAFAVILKDGSTAERHDLMHGVSLPQSEAEWFWTVAPYGELDPGYKAVHRVVAIRL
ncbi:MAG: hypothetical protein KL863_02080 [Rhizobium sp.]|nr:hypothetical protein [Rhizobium sp.]